MSHILKGVSLVVDHNGTEVKAEEFLKDKIVALYFSAGWCPPCRLFTPKLKKFYETVKEAGKNFEVIFVSRDRKADDLVEYYKDHHGDWAYLKFGDSKNPELFQKYDVKLIPSLRVIKPDGSVVVQDARTEVVEKGEKALELFEKWKSFYDV